MTALGDRDFVLHDPYTLAHFDLKFYSKPRGNRQDARVVEHILHRAQMFVRNANATEEARVACRALLDKAAIVCGEAKAEVQQAAAEIQAAFTAYALPDPLPELVPVPCSLRWEEPRMWVLVRALLAIDTANRQLNHLREGEAIDMPTFKKAQHRLTRPLRAAYSAVYGLGGSLPTDAKGPLRNYRARPVVRVVVKPSATKIKKDAPVTASPG